MRSSRFAPSTANTPCGIILAHKIARPRRAHGRRRTPLASCPPPHGPPFPRPKRTCVVVLGKLRLQKVLEVVRLDLRRNKPARSAASKEQRANGQRPMRLGRGMERCGAMAGEVRCDGERTRNAKSR
eukprot:4458756-Pleurochrysis_carterae.AAC.1